MRSDARVRRWVAFVLAALTALAGVACDYGDEGGGGAGDGDQQQQQQDDGGEDGGGTGY